MPLFVDQPLTLRVCYWHCTWAHFLCTHQGYKKALDQSRSCPWSLPPHLSTPSLPLHPAFSLPSLLPLFSLPPLLPLLSLPTSTLSSLPHHSSLPHLCKLLFVSSHKYILLATQVVHLCSISFCVLFCGPPSTWIFRFVYAMFALLQMLLCQPRQCSPHPLPCSPPNLLCSP